MKKIAIYLSVLFAIFSFNAVLAGGVPSSDGASDDESSIPVDLTDSERIEEGKGIFHSTCADYCHGHEPDLFIGRGDDLEPKYIYQTIFNGGQGATPMPPWGEVFSEDEIWSLVSYIKYLGAIDEL
ncbi:c-type cytochrome [Neptuniibacter marinus]|uniref:c-type cytochrome n=1 Tax=Neptuniibacter marinus TaxID=1806670 RepID=UPI00082D4331|nr:cytochrome c [Neptuniibacter marinus]